MLKPHNHLNINAYKIPDSFSQTMATKHLTETLLATDGKIVAAGHFWEIKSRRIGPGVYRVWLQKE